MAHPAAGTYFRHVPVPRGSVKGRTCLTRPLPCGQGELILVVDDDDTLRETTRRTLERHGYTTVFAANGAEGMVEFTRHIGKIAAVLTDLAMPVMDGAAMSRAIAAVDASMPIVASSGLDTDDDLVKETGAFIAAFVAKPYTAEALLTTVHRVVRARPGRR